MHELCCVEDLFPTTVEVVSLSDPASAEPLFAAEEPAIARAIEKRRIQFRLGRTAARRALSGIGLKPVALPANRDGSVAWPPSVWGSITHTEGLCVAAVALRRHHAGVGVDAELRARVRPELWTEIANDRELGWIEAVEAEVAARERATLLFSAKESFYKAQFCRSGRWVGFRDVELRSATGGAFELELRVDVGDAFAKGDRFDGHYVFTNGHVITGIALLPEGC